MDNGLTINNLHRGELNPALYDIIDNVRKKYENANKKISGSIKVNILNDNTYQPNLMSNSRIHSLFSKPHFSHELSINRGILKKFNPETEPDELGTIVAHEFSHLFNADVFWMKIIALIGTIIVIGVYVVSIILFRNQIIDLIITLFSIIVILRIFHFWKRKIEFRCDEDAARISNNPELYSKTLERGHIDFWEAKNTFTREIKIKGYLKKIYFCITGNDHPQVTERINNINKLKKLKSEKEV